MRHLLISLPLVRLMIDVCADRFHPKSEKKYCCTEGRLQKLMPNKFLYAVWDENAAFRLGEKSQALGKICKYHEHAQDEASIQACIRASTTDRKRKRDILDVEERNTYPSLFR